jgi:mediator complex subunit MED14
VPSAGRGEEEGVGTAGSGSGGLVDRGMPGRIVNMSSGPSANGAAGGAFINGGRDGISPQTNVTSISDSAKIGAPPKSALGNEQNGSGIPPSSNAGAIVNGTDVVVKEERDAPNGAVQKMPASVGNTSSDQQLLNGTLSTANPSSLKQLPPEIRHITEGFVSLGTLIDRVVQITWNDLQELLDRLVDLPVDTSSISGLSNGVGAAHNGRPVNEASNSIRKRHLWLDFAKTHRDQFIKLAVISAWSKSVEDVRMYIDLMGWSAEQFYAMEEIARSLGQLKLDLQPFKMPNPDIKTALEVLTTGKASWMPDVRPFIIFGVILILTLYSWTCYRYHL